MFVRTRVACRWSRGTHEPARAMDGLARAWRGLFHLVDPPLCRARSRACPTHVCERDTPARGRRSLAANRRIEGECGVARCRPSSGRGGVDPAEEYLCTSADPESASPKEELCTIGQGAPCAGAATCRRADGASASHA